MDTGDYAAVVSRLRGNCAPGSETSLQVTATYPPAHIDGYLFQALPAIALVLFWGILIFIGFGQALSHQADAVRKIRPVIHSRGKLSAIRSIL